MRAGGFSCLLLFLPWVGGFGGAGGGYRRKVSLEYNPGWNSSAVSLLHIQAVGLNDSIHYVWSTLGTPTVLLVYSGSAHSALRLNWTKLLSPSPSGAIWVEPVDSVLYSAAFVFTRVFEYSGAKTSDLSKVPPEDFYPTYDLSNFTWDGKLNRTALTATFRGVSADPGGTLRNGSVSFQVTAFEETSRDASLPHFLHTANSSKVDFVMRGVANRGNHSRFALEMLMVEEGAKGKQLQSIRSIDDEYTPTIFEMVQLVSGPDNDSFGSSFIQWKTVAYSSQHALREDTVHCQYYPLQAVNGTVSGPSIVHAYFTKELETQYSVSAINVSFGSEDNESYQEKGYLSWSALIGFGEPPEDAFSPLVIAILAVALGTPAVLLVVGSITVCVAQKRQYSEYEPIN
uniref:Glycosylated lysosomal membrane protein isoform X2 n=1 Tax=Pogona vitticeps TaxID=103695 RepID=A0ABM5F485_9SAUR